MSCCPSPCRNLYIQVHRISNFSGSRLSLIRGSEASSLTETDRIGQAKQIVSPMHGYAFRRQEIPEEMIRAAKRPHVCRQGRWHSARNKFRRSYIPSFPISFGSLFLNRFAGTLGEMEQISPNSLRSMELKFTFGRSAVPERGPASRFHPQSGKQK